MDIPECVTHTRRSAPEAAAPQWPTHRCNSRSRHRERGWLGQNSGSSQASELSQRIRETDFVPASTPRVAPRSGRYRSLRPRGAPRVEGPVPAAWRASHRGAVRTRARPTTSAHLVPRSGGSTRPTRYPAPANAPATGPVSRAGASRQMERCAKGRVTFESAETFVGWLSTHWPRGSSGLATSNAPQAGTSRTCDSCRAQARPYASAPTARSPRLRRSAAHSASVATSRRHSPLPRWNGCHPPAPAGQCERTRARPTRSEVRAGSGRRRGKQLPKEPGMPGQSVNEVRRRLK